MVCLDHAPGSSLWEQQTWRQIRRRWIGFGSVLGGAVTQMSTTKRSSPRSKKKESTPEAPKRSPSRAKAAEPAEPAAPAAPVKAKAAAKRAPAPQAEPEKPKRAGGGGGKKVAKPAPPAKATANENAQLSLPMESIAKARTIRRDGLRGDVAELLDVGRRVLHIKDYRPGQAEALEHILDREDVLAVMPTGSGKSLLYQLPSIVLPGVTVVVSPLIALIKDQIDKMQAKGLANDMRAELARSSGN